MAQKSTRTINKYTVLFAYPDWIANDPHESFMGHVRATNIGNAVKNALKQCKHINDGLLLKEDDIVVIAVIAGHVHDLYEHP